MPPTPAMPTRSRAVTYRVLRGTRRPFLSVTCSSSCAARSEHPAGLLVLEANGNSRGERKCYGIGAQALRNGRRTLTRTPGPYSTAPPPGDEAVRPRRPGAQHRSSHTRSVRHARRPPRRARSTLVPDQTDPFAAPFLGGDWVDVEGRRLDVVEEAVRAQLHMHGDGAPSRALLMGRWFGCLVRSG